jgi:sugar phosphate isomerase/epimerase
MIRKIVTCLFLALAVSPIFGQKITLGMATALENDSIIYSAGFPLIGTTVENLISPNIADSLFVKKLEQIRTLNCKIIMCNVLFPGKIKIAGPEVNEKQVLDYLESVLKRARKAGVPNLILGSGGARRLPDDYSTEKAKADFVILAGKMAKLAKKYDVHIILENLNSTETNFLTTLNDAADVVRKVNHSYLRLNCDIYHMMRENESPEEIVKAKGLITYCELAEKEGRTLPGVAGDDFRPYLVALKKIGFEGPMVIEGKTNDLKKDASIAFGYLTTEINEVFVE